MSSTRKRTAKVKLLFRGAAWMLSVAGIIGTVFFLISRLPENINTIKKQAVPILSTKTLQVPGKVTYPMIVLLNLSNGALHLE